VLDHADAGLRIVDDWPEPTAGQGEVTVQVHGVGICGSDLALLAGHRRPPRLPWIPGHETLGEIFATGPGVDRARVGERVVIEPNIPCLACPASVKGATSACPHRVILGFNTPGTLTERVAVPSGFAWPVPRDWTDGDAVCAEPLAAHGAGLADLRSPW